MNEESCTGKVISYDADRGHGKIKDTLDREFYVHYLDVIDSQSLNAGLTVTFVPMLHRKGNIAKEVRRS